MIRHKISAAIFSMAFSVAAHAQTHDLNIPGGDLKAALDAYVLQSGIQIIYNADEVRGQRSNGVSGRLSDEQALNALLKDTGLYVKRDGSSAAKVVVAANAAGKNGVRATAQRGIVYPAGSVPGAVIQLTQGASVSMNTRGIVRTYLNTRLQDQKVFDTGSLDVTAVGGLSGLVNVKATKPFNSVEVVFDGAYTGYLIDVYELCSDSRAR